MHRQSIQISTVVGESKTRKITNRYASNYSDPVKSEEGQIGEHLAVNEHDCAGDESEYCSGRVCLFGKYTEVKKASQAATKQEQYL